MLFNSYQFVVFLPVVFALYWLSHGKYRQILLLAANYFFYMWSGPRYGLLILGITLMSYGAALLIEKQREQKTKKYVLALAAIVSVGILFVYKYLNFFSTAFFNLMHRAGFEQDPVVFKLILPVGISFYTFQSLGYVIDVYRGQWKAEKSLLKYASFVSFFPQLLAGPIGRSKGLLPQMGEERTFDYTQAMTGVKMMLWGYYKKLVIADLLAKYVNRVFDSPREYSGFALVLASVFFAIQIYCDFSGYSDIAVGTAKLFGIELIQNFKSPYFATSIREFWSRWHISLSTWFRDYLYIPLGGNRVSKPRHYFNLMVTFLVSGLWHGANWTFIVWGGIHGFVQVIETAVFGRVKRSKHLAVRIVQMIAVFVICTIAWVFFVSHSVGDAFYTLTHCLSGLSQPIAYLHQGFADIGITRQILAAFMVFIIVLGLYDWFFVSGETTERSVFRSKPLKWAFYVCIGLAVVFFSEKGVAAEFIYLQF